MASQEDARAALQALLAATKPRSEAQKQASAKLLPDGQQGSESQDGARSPWRAEFLKVLRAPQGEAWQEEAEAKLARLVQGFGREVPTPTVQSMRDFKPPARVSVAVASQTDPCADSVAVEHPDPQVLLAAMVPEGELKMPPPPAPRRSVVQTEEAAANLRNQVKEMRRMLESRDKSVTDLTRRLKLCRINIWTKQKEQNAAEVKLSQILAERSQELPESAHKESEQVEQQETLLAEELGEARASASHWASTAKRQDGMLQQERDSQKGGDAQSILAKHPAGEVFLPWQRDDSDSEDGESARGGGDRDRRRYEQRRGREDVSLGSSDEEEEDFPSRGGARTLALARPQAADEEASEEESGSSVASPSASGDSPSGGRLPQKMPSEPVTTGSVARGRAVLPAPVRRARSSSPEESSEEDVKKTTTTTTTAPAARPGRGGPVPPLPELAGIMLNRHRQLEEDDAEEISYEEIEELSSRSV